MVKIGGVTIGPVQPQRPSAPSAGGFFGRYYVRYPLRKVGEILRASANKGRVLYGRFAHNERARTFTLKGRKGKKAKTFKKGALHRQLGVPEGEKIPESKKRAALAGRYGPLAKKRATAAFRGILAAGRKTARRRRRGRR